MKFLNYSLIGAYLEGVKVHPQEDMAQRFNVIHGVPQSLGDCWWFCVEDYDCELPPYISPMEPYSLEYWRDKCYKTCDFFDKAFDCATQTRHEKYSCWGGERCLKAKYGTVENFEAQNQIKY